jgi:hypothetical protein
MNSTLDLNLLLLARQNGEDRLELPDLYAAVPPRRAARGRETDSLIIYLSLVGNAPLNPPEQTKLLEELAKKFYKTTGSLTAALRSVAEAINLQLLDRNLRSTGAGRQAIGQLLLVALRGDTLYLAQSGAVQTYLVKPGQTQAMYDAQTSGRGLGLSQSTPVRFLQVKMEADDYLVLSTVPASAWSDSDMQHPSQQGIDALRHQLMLKTGQDFNAVIVQAQAGTGKLKVLKRKPGATPMVVPQQEVLSPVTAPASAETIQADQAEPAAVIPTDTSSPAAAPEPAPHENEPAVPVGSTSETPAPIEEAPAQPEVTAPVPVAVSTQATANAAAGATANAAAGATANAAAGATANAAAGATVVAAARVTSEAASAAAQPAKPITQQAQTAQPAAQSLPPSKTKTPAGPPPGSKQLNAIRVALAPIVGTIARALRSALATIGAALLRLLKNLLPDADVLRLPPSTMVFIAIAIPLILAVLGGVVFLQRGQAKQHQLYYAQAVEKADYAASLTNPLEQRLAIQTALGELDKAEEYAVTSQSQALRVKLTNNLDALDAVKRLDYKQAIVNGLETGVKVTRIVAVAADLYLLDGSQGSVLHAVLTSRGYELDPTFKCGPTQGYINVGPLVDIVELPPGGVENASLLGMDASGNLLYCVVGDQPLSATLAPPNTGLGSPIGMSLDRNDLYVLDPTVNAVWIYRNMAVNEQPRLFFGDTVPPMQDVIDLEVYNDELYMLHADGHTTKCTYSAMVESPTRCVDPYPYSDNRPGRVHGPVIEDTSFNQMDYITFPERSIFYLDPQHQAIYYFSVLLTLQYQYQPKSALAEGEATAFSISANRIAFLAVGSNVYYAAMP